MKTGLTLGKYSPFHKGHEHLLETALAEVDRLIVVIYNSPETTHIPLHIRAEWIRTLYPDVEVIEAWDGPTEVGDTSEIKAAHEAYLLKILQGRKIDCFYTAEFYGEHVSKALRCRLHKMDRSHIDVSGTLFRQDPYGKRTLTDPFVYKDYIMNIAFLGAPSSGKTTCCRALAETFQTEWMPEYGREYWEQHQKERRLTPLQLVEIAWGHLEREDKLMYQSNRYLFTDTNAITTYMFARYYHGEVHEQLIRLAEKAEKRYDLVFLCDTDIDYEDTWDRSGDVNRLWFQQQIAADLRTRKVPYIVLSGDLASRIKRVKKIIKGAQKYDNIWSKLIP